MYELTHTCTCCYQLATSARLERRLLSNVKYFDDYCLTHEDTDYMQRMYDVHAEQKDNYFVRQYPGHPEKIEMSFNISTYQPVSDNRTDLLMWPAVVLQAQVLSCIVLLCVCVSV